MKVTRSNRRKNSQKGFSLIELLIVVAIILIIAAIAIPRLLQARATSQEAAAGATMRTVNTSLAAYNSKFDAFPSDMKSLGGTCDATNPPTLTAGCTLDDTLAKSLDAGTKMSGYIFTYALTGAGANFGLNGDPAPGSSANKHYFSDSSNTIHYNNTAAATLADPAVGN